LVVLACGQDAATSAAAGETGSTGDMSGETTQAEGSDTSGGSDGSTTSPVPEFEPYPARGVHLTQVLANQGVSVPIVQDQEWVEGTRRNAELIKGRNTLIRGLWETSEDFEPRDLEARFTFTYSDGRTEQAIKTVWVEGESRPQELDTNIWVVVPGELIEPSMKFQVELLETVPGYETLPEPEILAYPPEPEYLGIEGSEMVLRTVLVPVQHDLGPDCPASPELDEAAAKVFEDQLYMQNPVERVELTVREPIVYTGSLNSFGGLLQTLAELRDADGADPAAYYYGLVRPCDGGPNGVGGQAIDIPGFPSQANGWSRTAVGRFYGSLSSTANTFVHEIGHTQGRRHIYCNGSEGGTDPSYPYADGDIGIWGFGVLDFTLHTPENGKDYMTYCGNTWVSDWGWHKVFPYIQEITSWESASAVVEDARRVLVGLIDPESGDETWFVTRGSAEGRTFGSPETFEVITDAGTTKLAASIGSMGDGAAYNVLVPLPDKLRLDANTRIERLHDGQRSTLDRVHIGGEILVLRPSQ
jgi:hypothetical protein